MHGYKWPINCTRTRTYYISITAEAWRGFKELGPVFAEIGKQAGRQDIADAGAMMTAECDSMQRDFGESAFVCVHYGCVYR